MATEPQSQPKPDDARTTDAGPGQQQRATTPPEGTPSGTPPAREADPAAGRDLPDENGEPPSVKRPGNPDASEPPVENF